MLGECGLVWAEVCAEPQVAGELVYEEPSIELKWLLPKDVGVIPRRFGKQDVVMFPRYDDGRDS